MIAIVDYGLGNLMSVQKAFEIIGFEAKITRDADVIDAAEKIVLPGVGAFSDAMECLRQNCLERVIIDNVKKEKPLLGICLGMQLLFDVSYEDGIFDGLHILEGKIERIDTGLKVPHVGWNSIDYCNDNKLFRGLKQQMFFYFVHSYYLTASEKKRCYSLDKLWKENSSRSK